MVTTPTFSIITVCLNARPTLERTIQSVAAQTCQDFEYIIQDGGSMDGTQDLVRAHSKTITAFVSEKDSGISDAFNRGLARARGRYVAMLNADDWYEPHALEQVAAVVERTHAQVVCGRLRYWKDGKASAVFDARPDLLRDFMSINHMAAFAARSLFVEHGGFGTAYKAAQDYELFLRFWTRGARFETTSAVLANMSLGGVSDRHWRRALMEVRQAQLANGLGHARAWRNYLFALAKGAARRQLEARGGQRVVNVYREKLARVKKTPQP